jgi:LPXTG-motif cell wall-anchored protein
MDITPSRVVTAGMVKLKLSQLIAAAGIAVASIAAFGGVAAAAPTASTVGVACVNGDGVMDLMVTNPAADAPAEFVITNPQTFVASVIDLGPASSQLVTVDGLADGSVVVPVQFNGTDASVSTQIACDAPTCVDGVLTTVTDDSGVQHQACVAVAAEAPAAAAPVRASLVPQRTTTTSPATLPTTGAGTGGLVIAALLVGSGSVASLVSRRKADRH